MTPPRAQPKRRGGRSVRGTGPTAERILDVAQEMVQKRGYNGFSFRDIAAVLDIKSASIHYHFPNKVDLATALVIRYREAFYEELRAIDRRQSSAPKRLKAFIELFRGTLAADRLCLCGMLANERDSLPAAVNAEVCAFFTHCEAWLIDLLKQGRSAGEIDFLGAPQGMADHILGLLEGAMAMARSLGDLKRFDRAAAALLRMLQPTKQA